MEPRISDTDFGKKAVADEKTYIEEMVHKYKPDVDKLTPFLPWLEEKKGANAHTNYDAENITEHTISFPVYDSTLMNFVNTANATSLMNTNYVYTYSRYRIRTDKEELDMIKRCENLSDLPELADVLSKYILKGMSKGVVWSEGVRNGALYHALAKMQEILKKYS